MVVGAINCAEHLSPLHCFSLLKFMLFFATKVWEAENNKENIKWPVPTDDAISTFHYKTIAVTRADHNVSPQNVGSPVTLSIRLCVRCGGY